MYFVLDRNLAHKEDITTLANAAEVQQHWVQAAILWRRIDEVSYAEVYENILQYLAENNFDQL